MNSKSLILVRMALFALALSKSAATAQTFDCGSNGSYGPMNITNAANTKLQAPPDGIFNCTTVTISSNSTLTFNRNASNTPIYILATGDVMISGTIDVSGASSSFSNGGLAGPGGFDGGFSSADILLPSGAGGGPGGGNRGRWISSSSITAGGNASFRVQNSGSGAGLPYGNNYLIPLIGGSGGGGGQGNNVTVGGGGGGGGAILIASNTKISCTLNGGNNIYTAGGAGASISTASGASSGSGTGGSVRLVAPKIDGGLRVNVLDGRYRIDTFDYSGLTLFGNPHTLGHVMVVFPNPMPKLSVSNAAGTAIAENTTSPVSVILPTGTNPSQTIQVRARDFGSVVPVRVRLVPESGDATTYDGTIDNTVNNPATVNIAVTMPINTGVRIEVFTR